MTIEHIDGVIMHDGIAYLNNWLKTNGYKDRDTFVNDSSVEGMSEEEIDSAWDEILEEFYDWCDKNGVMGEEV